MDDFLFRPATIADAPALGALVLDLLPYLTIDPAGKGADEFVAHIDGAAQLRYLRQPNFRYRLATRQGKLAGFIALRDNSHLFHLFVGRSWHGQGLGRRLWELARAEALAAGNPGVFTVNASDHALPMYRRFGFEPTGPREAQRGIAWTPMRLGSAGSPYRPAGD
ncbi:GNAT family N-acetyltransferase [Pseudoduganella armeniaca]|uniref:GNAT family N-acetyltransferase n=1 Tax=Pseudoduganella armeniaca TaxID=2072590 RepID=A0A2R4CEK3_9BURK|nr:GNAT family N-acetyltransferase [Pseudoduganella armeniaca]AVR98056.1 GNAT family N-acetyltransferase [Pseudoduganella armeniaca]